MWWLRFVGVVALLVLLALTVPTSKEVQLSRIDVRWLGLCMLLTMLQLLLEASVWYWLILMQGVRYPYGKAVTAYLASMYLGLVTPWHVGSYLSAGYITMDTGLTLGYALSSVVMKKMLGWIAIIGFGIWGLPLLAQVSFLHGVKQMVGFSLTAVLLVSIGIALWVFSLRRLTKRWQKLSPWQVDLTEFWSGMRHLAAPQMIGPLILSLIAFSLLFLQLHSVLRSMGIVLPFLLVCRIAALSRVAARLIPVSVAGIGTKDAVVMLLVQQGVAQPVVGVTAALLWLLCSYVVTLLLSGLAWWIRPLVVRRAARTMS